LSAGSGFAGIPDLRTERHRAAGQCESGNQYRSGSGPGGGAGRGSSKRCSRGYEEFNRRVGDRKRTGFGTAAQSTGSQSINVMAIGGASGTSPVLSIAGGASWGSGYSLDGANHVNYMTGTTMNMPFPDAMQEFKVETSGVNAQHGNSSAVSAVTKSGTNQFHGDLFEFLRNELFNARYYFATKPGTYKRNQFGGTVGGPIVQNKLFFFAGYQGTTIRQDPQDLRTFIPTAAMLSGDWTAVTSQACNVGKQINLRPPF